jgi:NADH:ubiquinone oxidoreductase subunit F (NADH-binding)/(2Fe-2S) ferredoxin/NAD-dependent dihydropyrimidine dehydrogenase PreA subunit
MNKVRTQLMLCSGTGCQASDSGVFQEALQKELESRGLADEIKIIETGCNGFCAVGPVMLVQPEGIFYQKLRTKDIPHLVEEHFLKGRPVKKLLYVEPASKETIPNMNEIPFFKHQLFRVMRNKGAIDPEVIDEYIARDGYFGAAKALQEMSPQQIIEEVKTSGLRGRGGAGFPTGVKWDFASKSPGEIKYVLCNADEGDPGAFMDRSVLEADPHAVLEGMLIAARAINAHQGYIYARTEYPLAIKRLGIAIKQAREYGLLGTDILQTGFDFDIDIYQGAGAFVCGEETALMRSIEGKRGMPRPRPPFPAHMGLWEKPTILNNVETLANIPQIILKGGKWYASIGTESSKGTKVFALSGDVNNIGLVEVPMGTTLRTMIYDIGGGVTNGKKFKAVQLGGPSGGCVPEQCLDIPIDYEEIAKVGAIMGSGGAIVMDENSCMVDMARFFMDFVQDESCGKCTPCREGTRRLLQLLEKICEGRGRSEDIDTLEELSRTIKEAALCGLGQTGPNPVLSTLRYFRDEYEAHVFEKRCPAKRCIELLRFEVEPELCTKCGLCFRSCPVEAITWKKKEVARIDKEKCIKCMTCFEKCKFDAIF